MANLNPAEYCEAFAKVAEYSRRFFHFQVYTNRDDLLLDATNNGPSQPWVSYLLESRYKPSNRHSIPEVRTAMTQLTHPKWFASFRRTLWSLYQTLRTLTTHVAVEENPLLRSLSKPQRRTLLGSRVVYYCRKPQEQRKKQILADFRQTLSGSVVQWGDNFAKYKYPSNPQSLRACPSVAQCMHESDYPSPSV